jgi:mRNA interferase RelE/StbE
VEIRYSKSASAALLRSNKSRLIREKIAAFAAEPDLLHPNVTRLKGQPEYRLRVQDWRVIFAIEGDLLIIRDIGPRGSVYEG